MKDVASSTTMPSGDGEEKVSADLGETRKGVGIGETLVRPHSRGGRRRKNGRNFGRRVGVKAAGWGKLQILLLLLVFFIPKNYFFMIYLPKYRLC